MDLIEQTNPDYLRARELGNNPFFTGTMWENIGPGGTATEARIRLAHGWASAPTPVMTGYVLGVQPVDPGYRTFTVAQHPRSGRTPVVEIFACADRLLAVRQAVLMARRGTETSDGL